ncbi:ATP-binding protein [Embleya sp. NPDC056575]|uniref:ATP-binding protein n=1 Tax=unclassified Embleya TaxID=2699296 RepID=UPI0036CB1F9D
MAQRAGGGSATPADPAEPPALRGGAVFEAVAAEVPRARRVLASALRRRHVHEDDVHTAQLIVCELLSNAIRHGSGPTMDLDVRIEPTRIHLAVRSRHARPRRLPRPNGAAEDSECGRGLRLVEALAVEWGSRPVAGELLVWATLARTAAGAGG